MAKIIRPWARQPQTRTALDKSHKLGRLLDHVWCAWDTSGWSTSGVRAAPHSATTMQPTARGMSLANTSAANTSTGTVPVLNTFPYIQIAYAIIDGITSDVCYLSGGGSLSLIQIASSTLVTATLRYNFGTTRSLNISVPGGTSLGVPLMMILQVISDTDYRFYCNGSQTSGTLSPGTINNDLTTLRSPGAYLNGKVFLVGYGQGKGVLTDGEALALTTNHDSIWRIFRPQQIIVPAQAAAAGGSFLGAWARGSTTLVGGGVHA